MPEPIDPTRPTPREHVLNALDKHRGKVMFSAVYSVGDHILMGIFTEKPVKQGGGYSALRNKNLLVAVLPVEPGSLEPTEKSRQYWLSAIRRVTLDHTFDIDMPVRSLLLQLQGREPGDDDE